MSQGACQLERHLGKMVLVISITRGEWLRNGTISFTSPEIFVYFFH